MTRIFNGGCACGTLRYRIEGDPLVMNDCQCRQCQRDSGTGHQSHLTFRNAAIETTGAATRWRMTGDGGTIKERGFCATCGSPVWMTFPDMPDLFIVTPASLDDPALYRPVMLIWAEAGHAWDHVDPQLPLYPRMPG